MILQCVRRNISVSHVAKGVILGCLSLGASFTAQAAKVVVTVKGVATGDDMYGIFGLGKNFRGQDFTLVFTFDDAGVRKITGDQCPLASHSEGTGSKPSSPATAVLSIGIGSFTFGSKANADWAVSRTLDSICSGSMIGMALHEGTYPQAEGFDLRLVPPTGKPPITRSLDWHSPVIATDFDNDPRYGTFMIVHPGDFQRLTKGYLYVRSVAIQ